MKLRTKIFSLMGSSLFCGVVGLTGLLHWGSAFRAESSRIAAPAARVQIVKLDEELVWFYLVLLGMSLGSFAWLLLLLERQVLRRLQSSGREWDKLHSQGSPSLQHLVATAGRSPNATLEARVQRQTAQLQQALNYAATLRRITDKVRDSLEEEQILQTAVQELANRLQVLGCNAGLYDLGQHISRIVCEAGPGLPPKQDRTVPMEPSTSNLGSAAQTGLYSRLLAGEPVLLCQVPAPQQRKPLLCLACPIFDRVRTADGLPFTESTQPSLFSSSQISARTPSRYREQELAIFGDLWLFKPVGETFSESEIRLVQQVATQCAIGLRQARLYKALHSQVEQLQSLHQLKDDFLNAVSHELRTPMSNIKMSLYMLRKTQDEERRQRYLNILEAECNREIELINDLLDLQRLEAGVDRPCSEPIDLTDWIPAQLRAFDARVAEYQQTLRVEWDPTLGSGPQLWTDSQRLSRILQELINNACKYTAPVQEIRLSITSQSTEGPPEETYIRFAISNPAEIPAEQLPRLFDKFYRVPSGDPWKRGGTGLGLALVKTMLEQLGGRIGVTSQGGLTTFWFLLPQNPPQPNEPKESVPAVAVLP